MNGKRLIRWLVIFCVLLVYVLLFERTEQPGPAAVMPAETYTRVFALEPSEISGVLVSDGEKTVRLALQGNDLRVVEPAGDRIAQDLIDSLLSAVTETVIIDELEPGPDQGEYGLSPPAFTLQVQSRAGAEPLTLLLGATAPSMINMYARLPQQNRTILLGTYLRFTLRTFLDNVKEE
jgi:hypothetical protein